MEWLLMLSKFMVIWTKQSYVSWPADPPVQTRAYCRPACVHLDPSESDSIFLWQPPLCAPTPHPATSERTSVNSVPPVKQELGRWT